MQPESALLRAARVFNFRTDDIPDDDFPIGKIRGVIVYAGEIRRLNQAIANEDIRRAKPDTADEGPEAGLIKAFRAFPEGSYSRDYWRHVRDSSL